MSIPRVDLLIADTRIASLQKDYGDEYGIQQDFFIVALNKANNVIQRYLVTEMAEPFAAYKDLTGVTDQVNYSLPTDIFIPNLVYTVNYSGTGLERDLCEPLQKMDVREYGNGSGSPYKWLVDGNVLYLDQAPVGGSLIRIRYERRLNKLDIRRGQVSTVTDTSSSVTVLTLDTASDDETNLPNAEYLTTVDAFGNVTCRNIAITSYDTTTGAVTLYGGSHTYDTGENISAGDYVCIGNSASTHFQLPDCFEDYYIDFVKNEVYELLSEDEQQVSNPKLDRILAKCAELYSQMPSGHTPIPENRRYY